MRIKVINPDIAQGSTAALAAARAAAKGPVIGSADLLAEGSR